MKAILIKENKQLVWDNVPTPEINDNQLLIKVSYAAVNRADLMQREGCYPPPPDCPDWMGLEISGTIAEIGKKAKEKSNYKIGDKICALLGGGGYAEYAAVNCGMAMPIPKNFTMAEAAATPEAFATAYLNLFIVAGIKKGDTLLMHAGASGLASVVIPMAKAFGIRVITTIIDETKREAVKKLGADFIVNTKDINIAEVLKEQDKNGTPVNVAIDCLGSDDVGECLPFMAYGGKWIMIATLKGDFTKIDLKKLYVKNVHLTGSTLRSKTPEKKAQILASLVKDVFPKAEKGLIKPAVYKILPITEADNAHKLLSEQKSAGKVVLRLPDAVE